MPAATRAWRRLVRGVLALATAGLHLGGSVLATLAGIATASALQGRA